MKLSIFTPAHTARYLPRLADSIRAQTHPDREWVVLANGALGHADAEAATWGLATCHRSETGPIIGALKHEACLHCTGDILVEVDHDDEITPGCLARLAEVFSDPTVDFAYSDYCEVGEDWQSNVYSPYWGWETYPIIYRGHALQAHRAFEPTPQSMVSINFGANHIRAWRRSFYEKIGGHNVTLDVADDLDLVIRTYLNGKMVHVPECLYIYHTLGGDNTCAQKWERIAQLGHQMREQYFQGVVERWCSLEKLPKVDLCCGAAMPRGWVGADLKNGVDLDGRWPWADSSVGVFRAYDALEYLKDPKHVMEEAHRCLVHGGYFLTHTPSTDGRGAYQDPTYVSFWNSNSFWYYTQKTFADACGFTGRFMMSMVENRYPTAFHKEHLVTYVRADLVALKGGPRPPGAIDI